MNDFAGGHHTFALYLRSTGNCWILNRGVAFLDKNLEVMEDN